MVYVRIVCVTKDVKSVSFHKSVVHTRDGTIRRKRSGCEDLLFILKDVFDINNKDEFIDICVGCFV